SFAPKRSRKAGRGALRPRVETLEDRLTPSTFIVSTTGDAGAGSLRAAISLANAHRGADRINFAIPTGDAGFVDANHNGRFDAGDYWSITLGSALPAITETVQIDGRPRQGRPVIELNGAAAGAGANGLVLEGHRHSTVNGLVINRFDGS